MLLTLGQTRTQETGDLLDQRVGSDESIVFASELLDQLLVLVELLQVIGAHLHFVLARLTTLSSVLLGVSLRIAYGVDTTVLGTVEIVLVTKNADGHVGAGDGRQANGTRETLVTLGVVVLQADLELDGLQKVSLLLIERVVQELLDVGTNSGDCDLRHGCSLPLCCSSGEDFFVQWFEVVGKVKNALRSRIAKLFLWVELFAGFRLQHFCEPLPAASFDSL